MRLIVNLWENRRNDKCQIFSCVGPTHPPSLTGTACAAERHAVTKNVTWLNFDESRRTILAGDTIIGLYVDQSIKGLGDGRVANYRRSNRHLVKYPVPFNTRRPIPHVQSGTFLMYRSSFWHMTFLAWNDLSNGRLKNRSSRTRK